MCAGHSLAAPLSPFARPLPHVRVGGISGLLELMHEQGDGLRDIPLLAERLQLEVDDLLPLLDAARLRRLPPHTKDCRSGVCGFTQALSTAGQKPLAWAWQGRKGDHVWECQHAGITTGVSLFAATG